MSNSSWGKDTDFYRKSPWLKLREAKIEENPLCELCESVGKTESGKFIDHILNRIMFPDYELEPDNLQTLCERCHSQKTRLESIPKTKAEYIKEMEEGRLRFICTKKAKEKLFELIEKLTH